MSSFPRTLVAFLAVVALALPGAAGIAHADPTPLTGAVLQSQDDSSFKVGAAVAGAPNGRFVCAWNYDALPAGSWDVNWTFADSAFVETANTSQPTTDTEVAVACASTGRFVVVWRSGALGTQLITGQVYEANGTPVGSEITIPQASPNNRHPGVSWAPDGSEFVVIWSRVDSGNSQKEILARRFDSSGSPLSSDTVLATEPLGLRELAFPVVSHAADGTLLAVWTRGFVINSPSKVEAARLTSTLTVLNGPVELTTPSGLQSRPDVSHAPDGSSVVVWEASPGDGSGYAVLARRLDALGNPIGGVFQINTTITGDQRHPAVGHASDGSFVVVYKNGNFSITAQCLDSAGLTVGSEVNVQETTSPWFVADPDLSFGDDDRFTVVWKDQRIRSRLYQLDTGPTSAGILDAAGDVQTFAAPSVFRVSTRIRYALEAPSAVDLRIFDAAGRLVRVLDQGVDVRGSGSHRRTWDGRDGEGRPVPSGVYFYRVSTSAWSAGGRVVRVR